MAIRFEHQPGAAGGLAYYAAGFNRARERRRKYALEMWQQERRHEQEMQRRMFDLQARYALGGRRGFGAPLGEPRLGRPGMDRMAQAGIGLAGEAAQMVGLPGGALMGAGVAEPKRQRQSGWQDPFQMAQTTEDKLQIRAQRQANQRAAKSGKPIPYPNAEPQYIPPPTKEEAAREAAKLAHQRALEMQEGRQAFDIGMEETKAARTWVEGEIAETKQDIEDDRYSAEDKAKLRAVFDKLERVLGSKRFSDEATREEALKEPLKELEQIRSRMTAPPTLEERAAKQTFIDKTTGREMWWSGDPKDKPEPMVDVESPEEKWKSGPEMEQYQEAMEEYKAAMTRWEADVREDAKEIITAAKAADTGRTPTFAEALETSRLNMQGQKPVRPERPTPPGPLEPESSREPIHYEKQTPKLLPAPTEAFPTGYQWSDKEYWDMQESMLAAGMPAGHRDVVAQLEKKAIPGATVSREEVGATQAAGLERLKAAARAGNLKAQKFLEENGETW